jgi:radical SAM protein with 4Fe4S-binding SPASM domain
MLTKRDQIADPRILKQNSIIPVCVCTKFPSSGFRVFWQLTSKCNRNCRYCFSSNNSKDIRFVPSLVDNILITLLELKTSSIVLSGGEPLLSKDFPHVVEKIYCAGIDYTLCTNSDYLESHLALLERYRPSSVNLSVESSSEHMHDSIRGIGNFANVVSAIRKLANLSIPVKINIVGNENNSDSILDTIGFFSNLGVSNFSISPLWNYSMPAISKSDEYFDHSLNISWLRMRTTNLQDRLDGCKAGKNLFSIYSDGSIGPCLAYDRRKFPYKASIFDPIIEIEKQLANIANWIDASISQKCLRCGKLRSCGKGCAAAKSAEHVDPLCDLGNLSVPPRL